MTADITTMPAGPEIVAGEEPEPERRRRRKALLFLLLLIGLFALFALTIWYLLFRQPIPLPPILPTAIPHYSTSIYGADTPVGIAVTPSGDRIYVAETGGDKVVRIFDAGGRDLGTMEPPATTGAEHVPVYVAIDPLTSEVYVTDRPTGSVYVYDRDGAYQREYRPEAVAEGWQPVGIGFDKDGNVYVSDWADENQAIKKFDRAGTLVLTYGESEKLSYPNGVVVASDGRLYVTDSNNGRLLVYAPTGELVSKVGRGAGAGNLGLPRGLAADGQGRLFVVDSSGNGVLVYRTLVEGERQPEHLGFFGGHGIEDGKFSFPIGIAVDDRGRVYVSDTANGRIQIWSY